MYGTGSQVFGIKFFGIQFWIALTREDDASGNAEALETVNMKNCAFDTSLKRSTADLEKHTMRVTRDFNATLSTE